MVAKDIGLYFDKHFDGEYNFLYIPPEQPTEYDTVVAGENVAHIAFDVFEAYGKNFLAAHRNLVSNLLNRLLPNPIVQADELPVFARTTVFDGEEYAILNVKTTFPESKLMRGSIDEHVVLPAGYKVMVKGVYTSAMEVLSGNKLEICQIGKYTQLTLPEIVGFTMIVLNK